MASIALSRVSTGLIAAALLRTFAFDEVPGVQRKNKAKQQRGSDQAGKNA